MIFNPVVIKKGGPAVAVSPKKVNFYDYDGTLVYSYTLSEARALTALPDGPVHDGLVFQGWNWTLEEVKSLTRPMNVGAMYITDDGKTRLKIRVWDKARSNVPLYISQTVSNGVAIDWGDGSAAETLSGIGKVNTSHQYASAGDYTIAFSVAEECVLGFGHGESSKCLMWNNEDNWPAYCNLLQEVFLGDNVTGIDNYTFQKCSSLTSVAIPNTVTKIGTWSFAYCYSLKSITIPYGATDINHYMIYICSALANISIPDSVTNIGTSALNGCSALANISIPDSVTSIGTNVFKNCSSLASVVIPENMMNIGANAFQNCYSVAEYHFKPKTPPTLAGTNVFEGISPDCVIYVPAGSLDTYKTAKNWSVYADYMREEMT